MFEIIFAITKSYMYKISIRFRPTNRNVRTFVEVVSVVYVEVPSAQFRGVHVVSLEGHGVGGPDDALAGHVLVAHEHWNRLQFVGKLLLLL